MSRVSLAASHSLGQQSRDLIRYEALRSPTTWHGKTIPTCFYDVEAADIVRKVDGLFDLSVAVKASAAHYRVLSHVWRYALYSTAIIWAFWFGFPYLILRVGVCDKGVSHIPESLVLSYLPVLLVSLGFECKLLASKIPVQAAFLGGFTVFGFKVPFALYYGMVLAMSVMGHMDVATNAMTFSKVLHSSHCPGSRVEHLWSKTLRPSYIPIASFGCFATIAYYSMAFQLLYGLFGGVPMFTNDNRRVKGLHWWLNVQHPEMVSPYALTLMSWPREAWSPELVSSLGFVSRMISLEFRATELFEAAEGAQIIDQGGDPWTRATVARRARLETFRILLVTCLEGSVFLLVQSFELSVEKAVDGVIDQMTLWSIMLSGCFSSLQVLMTIYHVIRLVSVLWPELTDDRGSENDSHWKSMGYTEMHRSSLKYDVVLTICILCLAVVIFVCLAGAVATMIIMIHDCDSGLWDPTWPLRDGCIDGRASVHLR